MFVLRPLRFTLEGHFKLMNMNPAVTAPSVSAVLADFANMVPECLLAETLQEISEVHVRIKHLS